MDHKFFSRPDLKKLADSVESRGVQRADVEKLFEEVRKNIVVPLQTLNRNRPGNENNEAALEQVSTLCNTIKAVIAREEAVHQEERSSSHRTVPGA
ncbi:MAG: hypothetical protein P1U61_03175 [Legionellaceae bacterium]|nr:hypothetical protein [Legionellaceae bacterium]